MEIHKRTFLLDGGSVEFKHEVDAPKFTIEIKVAGYRAFPSTGAFEKLTDKDAVVACQEVMAEVSHKVADGLLNVAKDHLADDRMLAIFMREQ